MRMRHTEFFTLVRVVYLIEPRLEKLTQCSFIVILLSKDKFQHFKKSKLNFLAQYLQNYFSLKVGSFFRAPRVTAGYLRPTKLLLSKPILGIYVREQ